MKTAAIYFSLSGTRPKHALAPFTLSKAEIQNVKFIKRDTNLFDKNIKYISPKQKCRIKGCRAVVFVRDLKCQCGITFIF